MDDKDPIDEEKVLTTFEVVFYGLFATFIGAVISGLVVMLLGMVFGLPAALFKLGFILGTIGCGLYVYVYIRSGGF
jgi:hypothetical protein